MNALLVTQWLTLPGSVPRWRGLEEGLPRTVRQIAASWDGMTPMMPAWLTVLRTGLCAENVTLDAAHQAGAVWAVAAWLMALELTLPSAVPWEDSTALVKRQRVVAEALLNATRQAAAS